MKNLNQGIEITPKSFLREKLLVILGVFITVILGVATGWLLSGMGKTESEKISLSLIGGQKEAGILDENTFKGDTAEGILREGGINGDGTHHLEREGGKSQTVYLASTAVDLQSFVNKKVKVWGETQSVKKAGWFMDVVKIKVIE